ncbi:cyclophilin-like fold protein [Streptomyces sp. NPDC005899]|uniref:cyclophilin-like fold protein n=1 Tax=Streptomyces sp. NPDC005899 TaxID=3155716 RepID=UPI0033C99A9F
MLAVTACSTGSGEAAPPAPPSASARRKAAATHTPPSATPTSSHPSDRSTAMDIRVTLDGHPVEATLNDSPAARDFAALLPLSLDLADFHDMERTADLPRELDTAGSPAPVAARAGDIAYYAPWGNLALFHRDGPDASADLLVLGHLDVSADQLGEADRITVEAATT